jgi:hypothetical protein
VTFLYPTLLYFLPLAALPFIIHLVGERRHQPYDFSSLKFLREIEYESLKKLRWRQWLILLLRTLAIVFFILALAKPLFRGFAASSDSGILLIDRSFSTRQDPDFSLKAAEAEKVFEDWALLFYDENSGSDTLRRKILDNIRLNGRHEPALLLISDFQDNPQTRDILAMLSELPLRPAYLSVPKKEANAAISGLEILPEETQDGLLSLELRTSGGPVSVQIHINGRAAGRVNTGESGTGIFRFDPGDAEYVRCVARSEDDAYPADNIRYCVVRPYRQIRILDISAQHPSGYHQKAFRAMRGYSLHSIDPEYLPAEDLQDYDLLILSAFSDLPDAQQERILAFSEKRPALYIADPLPGENKTGDFYTEDWIYRDLGEDFSIFQNRYAHSDPFRIHRYFQSRSENAEPVWRLDNGDPLMIRSKARRYVLFSPFLFNWNEMGLSPYFTRMLSGFIRQALQLESLSYETGDLLDPDLPRYTVRTPGGELHQMQGPFRGTETPGFYVLESENYYREVAVNIPSTECIQQLREPAYPDTLLPAGSDLNALSEELRGRDIQALFFILAVACLLAEMLLTGKGEQTASWKK